MSYTLITEIKLLIMVVIQMKIFLHYLINIDEVNKKLLIMQMNVTISSHYM